MRIFCTYHGKHKTSEISEREFAFGRAEDKFPIGLDLTPDAKVSRLHGRIWFENEAWWIEDRNSSRGTRLNDVEIKERGKHQLRLHEIIEVGGTTLEIESLEVGSAVGQTSFLEVGTALIANEESASSEVAIAQDVDATDLGVAPLVAEVETARRLKIICDLPMSALFSRSTAGSSPSTMFTAVVLGAAIGFGLGGMFVNRRNRKRG